MQKGSKRGWLTANPSTRISQRTFGIHAMVSHDDEEGVIVELLHDAHQDVIHLRQLGCHRWMLWSVAMACVEVVTQVE
jgi:hypothetical protein